VVGRAIAREGESLGGANTIGFLSVPNPRNEGLVERAKAFERQGGGMERGSTRALASMGKKGKKGGRRDRGREISGAAKYGGAMCPKNEALHRCAGAPRNQGQKKVGGKEEGTSCGPEELASGDGGKKTLRKDDQESRNLKRV